MSDRDRTQSATDTDDDNGEAPAASTAETDTDDDNGEAPAASTAETDTDDDSASTSPTSTATSSSDGSVRGGAGRTRGDVRNLILRGALVVLGFVAVVALFQFYTSAVAVINEWVGREYRALFRAAFNLVVLLAAGIGISVVVRELTDTDGGGA